MITQRWRLNLLYVSTAPMRWLRMAKAVIDQNAASLVSCQARPRQIAARPSRKTFNRK
jgi:hypothetical protein